MDYLRSVGGDRNTSPSDRDWHIPKLAEFLKSPSIESSRLIWQTIMSIPSGSDYFQAAYRRNYSGGTHDADSRLLHELRAAEWVPKSDGAFVRPAAASSELLPKGFPFDSGYAALKALNFGTDAVRSLERPILPPGQSPAHERLADTFLKNTPDQNKADPRLAAAQDIVDRAQAASLARGDRARLVEAAGDAARTSVAANIRMGKPFDEGMTLPSPGGPKTPALGKDRSR